MLHNASLNQGGAHGAPASQILRPPVSSTMTPSDGRSNISFTPSDVSGTASVARGRAADLTFTSRYTVLKTSWRGKYTRIFAIGPSRIATIDPKTIFKVTNSFEYGTGFLGITPSLESMLEFTVLVSRGGGKVDTMTFACNTTQERAELLTDIQRLRDRFDVNSRLVSPQPHGGVPLNVFETQKLTFNETHRRVNLRITCVGLDHVDPVSGATVGEYLFYNIKGLSTIEGRPTTVIIAHGPVMKLHLHDFISAEAAAAFTKALSANAIRFIGLPPYRPMKPLTTEQFTSDRYGAEREELETPVEFAVLKLSRRHAGAPARRLVGTAHKFLVERDPATYNTVGAYPLLTIFALVRCADDAQRFCIHFKDPDKVKTYTSPQRDALLAHLVDACRAVGNLSVSVGTELVERGRRSCSFRSRVTEEMESTLLNSLADADAKSQTRFEDVVSFFNANVDYNGLRWSENKDSLFAENREKLIYNAMYALLFHSPIAFVDDPNNENSSGSGGGNRGRGTSNGAAAALVQRFQALRRLTVSRTGYSSVALVPAVAKAVGVLSARALKLGDMAVTYALVDFLNTLMTPMHDHYEIEHESINKNRIAGADSFLDSLLSTLRQNIYTESASLVVQELLNLLVYALCPPYSETTDARVFNRVLSELVTVVGKPLFPLLNHPCHAIRYASGQLIRVVMEEGNEEQFRFMQRAALTEGGVLMEFNVGAFSKNRRLRDLARRLLAYWAYDNVPMQDLLRRMIPLTLLNYLQSQREPPHEEREQPPEKGVTQMTDRSRESKTGWFKKSFHPKTIAQQQQQQQQQSGEVQQRVEARRDVARLDEPDGGASDPALHADGHPAEASVANSGAGVRSAGSAADALASSDPVPVAGPSAPPPPPPPPTSQPQLASPSRIVVDCAARMRVRHVNVHTTLNWAMLFYQLSQNHLRPDLIWNHTTRDELRHAVGSELEAFQMGAELRQGDKLIAWNYQEFEVVYHSLDEEICIGQHYYPRLLFESARPVVARPREFFNELYHRFLLVDEVKGKLECLHGMSLLYKFYSEQVGEFSDLPFLVGMFRATTDPAFRDRMLLFFANAMGARHNIKLFLDCNALAPLAELVTLAQLHIDRPQVHAVSNAIEASGGSLKDMQAQEKEWYYSKSGVKADPVSFTRLKELYKAGEVDESTKVWAQGLSGWKQLRDVPQLRWGVVALGRPSILTYTEVTCTILDIFQKICDHYPTRDPDGAIMQPLPRVKRYLSSPAVLPHLVQLLLTFDSAVCARVHRLLYVLMEDNPLIGRFFLTGVFYFSLLYTASDVLPLARLLALTHRQQSYQYSASDNATVRSSILAPLLPPGMVCFLAHHGPEKFADVLLGEYETPVIIWGKDMRRFLAGKIAAHVADFTPRLLGNNLVQYQYCPIVSVEYEALQHELFCGEYYLRHLCDEARYPNWPIREPIELLRDVLATWRAELQKQPCALTREGCLAELELTERAEAGEELTPSLIRKAYFVLAAKFHPDKNPNGRERFERIQEAYEFLASNRSYSTEPDPVNIRLLLKSQTILFRRYGDVLRDFKYAGYSLLLTLIRKELADEKMLEKEVVLMEPAAELCFATVKNVPLNADELQEEGGLQLLSLVASKCFSHINVRSTSEQPEVKVATSCMLTFAVSAQFKDCRVKLLAEKAVPYLAAKGVAYHGIAMPLARACIQCCETLCLDRELQARVTRAGAVWHLLRLLFCYDPTIESAGVALEEAHHAQLFANRAAELAIRALYAVTGLHPDASYCETARNEVLVALLRRLLTPYVAHKMETVPGFEKEALVLLNGNWETPYFLWNNSSRAELGELLVQCSDVCRDASIEATAAELPSYVRDGSAPGTEAFTYSLHKGEVIIGGVFVRVYVAQPAYPIEDPPALFHAMLDFLSVVTGLTGRQGSGARMSAAEREADEVPPLAKADTVAMVATALTNLALSYPGTTTPVAAERMPIIVQVLGSFSAVRHVALAALGLVDRLVPAESCLAALGADPLTITRLTAVLHAAAAEKADEPVLLAALQLLRVVLAHRPLVQQALDRGLYVVLLLLYATAPAQTVKEAASLCMGKAFSDKLVGPKLYLRCAAYLPGVFLDAMREGGNPAQACVMLDAWQENPELLWTKAHKAAFIAAVAEASTAVGAFLRAQPTGTWTPKDSGEAQGAVREGLGTTVSLQSVQVGGVYLALYLEQAGWQVRKPKEFLVALLDAYLECVEKVAGEGAHPPSGAGAARQPSAAVLRLNLITDSGVRLLSTSASIRDYAASLGYMHRLIDLVATTSGAGSENRRGTAADSNLRPIRQLPITALRWLHELWGSTPCVEATTPRDVVGPLMGFLFGPTFRSASTDGSSAVGAVVLPSSTPYVPLVMESLERVFTNATPRVAVVAQAVQHGLVPVLLRLLETGIAPVTDGEGADAVDKGEDPTGSGSNGAGSAREGLVAPTALTPAATRALMIKVLKAILASPSDEPRVGQLRDLLASSAVWAKYKDQSHDLFLTSGNVAAFGGYLTSGSPRGGTGAGGTTLALTVAAANTYQDVSEPPPLQE